MRAKLLVVAFVVAALLGGAAESRAKGSEEYDAVVKHLKTRYQAKKVKIPFLWLARFAVGVVRPAGVSSFSITTFQNLKFSEGTVDRELQSILDRSYGKEWSPVLRMRSSAGQHAYMYVCPAGKSVKLTVVAIEGSGATIVRATFSPEKLAEFINDPKILGISFKDVEPAKADANKEQKQLDGGK
jgi:hypothetical protein